VNERIRELWDRAAASSAAYPSGRNNSWQTQVNFINTFAELVILECAIYLENEYGKSVITGNDAADFIRQHFEVDG
jgi:hypothetical protein